MKNMKRLISMLLATVMVLGLAACGKPAAGSTSNEEQIKLTIGIPSKANVSAWNDNKLTLWLEEETGYDLEIINFSSTADEYRTQLATMVSGGEKLPDILLWFDNLPVEYEQDGYFFDLATFFDDEEFMKDYDYDDMLKKNLDPVTLQRVYNEGRDPDGHWWAFPYIGYEETPEEFLFINKVWLDKLGLEMPKTWDDFVNVMTAFRTQDPNGNGIADEIPMIGSAAHSRSNIPNWIINNFISYHYGSKVQPDENGQMVFTCMQDGFREGVRAGRKLYDAGLLSDMAWTVKENSELASAYTPADGVAKCGIITGYFVLTCTKGNDVIKEYIPLEPLQDSYISLQPAGLDYWNYITADCENPEAAFNVLCTLAGIEGSRRQYFGEEGVDWEFATDYETGEQGVYVLNDDAFAGQTDSTWAINLCQTGWLREPGDDTKDIPFHQKADPNPPAESGELDWDGHYDKVTDELIETWVAYGKAHNPETVYKSSLIYTAEEEEKNGNASSDIYHYTREMIAKFMTGVLDIDNDADWQNFCDTIMNNLNGKAFLETSQAAYERYLANAGE